MARAMCRWPDCEVSATLPLSLYLCALAWTSTCTRGARTLRCIHRPIKRRPGPRRRLAHSLLKSLRLAFPASTVRVAVAVAVVGVACAAACAACSWRVTLSSSTNPLSCARLKKAARASESPMGTSWYLRPPRRHVASTHRLCCARGAARASQRVRRGDAQRDARAARRARLLKQREWGGGVRIMEGGAERAIGRSVARVIERLEA